MADSNGELSLTVEETKKAVNSFKIAIQIQSKTRLQHIGRDFPTKITLEKKAVSDLRFNGRG